MLERAKALKSGIASSISDIGSLPEKKLREVFDQYDKDKSGTCDHMELLCMLDELKLGKHTTEQSVAFLTEYLMESGADEDGDGVLDFEEFKKFCHSAKSAKKAPVKGKDAKALSDEMELARREIKEKKLKEKAEAAAKLAEENKEQKRRLKEAGQKGRDAKCLDAETEAERKKKEEERKEAEEKNKKDIEAHTKALKEGIDAQVD